jgi:hypothetical protein
VVGGLPLVVGGLVVAWATQSRQSVRWIRVQVWA